VNNNTIQKGLFDLTLFVSKTDIQEANLILKNDNIEDHYGAIAMAAILNESVFDIIKGKR